MKRSRVRIPSVARNFTNSLKLMSVEKKQAIIITGATGSGKSKYAVELAKKINGIIVNCDSMQIYKQIPILSAQPNQDEQHKINHLMYGFVDIFNGVKKEKNVYSVGNYLTDLKQTLQNISQLDKKKTPIIVGGTMLYIESILNGLNAIPEIDAKIRENIRDKYKHKNIAELFEDLEKIDKNYANIVDNKNYQRILRGIEVKLATGKSIIEFWQKQKHNNFFTDNYDLKKILIQTDREKLYNNINKRFDKMVELGAIDEAKLIYDRCLNDNIDYTKLPKAIGMHRFFEYFRGVISLDVAIDKSKQESRNYAKRQMTWFRNRFKDFSNIAV